MINAPWIRGNQILRAPLIFPQVLREGKIFLLYPRGGDPFLGQIPWPVPRVESTHLHALWFWNLGQVADETQVPPWSMVVAGLLRVAIDF